MRSRLSVLAVAGCLVAAAILPAAAQTASKVGVFDPQRITQETAEGARIQARLNALQDKKRGELEKAQDEIKKLQDEYIAGATSMSADKQKELSLRIDRKKIELEGMQRSAQQELQAEADQAQQSWQRTLLEAVVKYGKEKAFTVILPSDVVPYYDPAVDVTEDLIKRIDAAAAAPKAPAAPPAAPPAAAPAKPAGSK